MTGGFFLLPSFNNFYLSSGDPLRNNIVFQSSLHVPLITSATVELGEIVQLLETLCVGKCHRLLVILRIFSVLADEVIDVSCLGDTGLWGLTSIKRSVNSWIRNSDLFLLRHHKHLALFI